MKKKKNMSNKLMFGQRIATVWHELVEHLHTLSNEGDDDPPHEQQKDLAARKGADGANDRCGGDFCTTPQKSD